MRTSTTPDPVAHRRSPTQATDLSWSLPLDDGVVHGGPLLHLGPGTLTAVEASVGSRALRNQLVVHVAARGRSVLHIVCGEEPDTSGLVQQARELGLQADTVLNASVVVRALTAEEMLRTVEQVVPHLVAGRNDVGAVVITDPATPLSDESVDPQLARAMAAQAASSLTALAGRMPTPILVMQGPERAARSLFAPFVERAGQHLRIIGTPGAPERTLEFPRTGERTIIGADHAAQARLEQFSPPEATAQVSSA